MWCVIGALAALQQRERTGVGCVVDASLFESAVAWVQGPLNAYNLTGSLPARHGAASATLAPYQIFETADRPICIAAGNDRLFVKLAPRWDTRNGARTRCCRMAASVRRTVTLSWMRCSPCC